jgi:hypothetical protein
MHRAFAGLREMCDSQREAMAAAGHQSDAERFAIEDVLLEELESWFVSEARVPLNTFRKSARTV